MQYLTEWRRVDDSRKRAAEDCLEESSRKRTRDDDDDDDDDDDTRPLSNGTTEEYKIRGSSTFKKHSSLNHIATSPLPPETLPSPLLSSIHPDRRVNLLNSAPTPLQPRKDNPSAPLSVSPSPKRVHNAESEEKDCNPLPSLSHTLSTGSGLDPTSPDSASVMPSSLNEKSRESQSHDPRRPPIDGQPHGSRPPSRRQSDVMQPPRTAAKSTRAEASTPSATSPPTGSKLENRRVSTTQPKLPLLDSLNGFAQAIMSNVSLTVKRDLTKQQAVGQQRERDRQSKFRSTFLTLVEDAESRAEALETVSAGIEKHIILSSQTQSNIAMTLAAQLQKAQVPDTLFSAQDEARLQDEIADIKASLETTQKETSKLRKHSRFTDDLADLKADLRAAEKKISLLNHDAVMADELRRKLRGLATQDELRGLITKDELRRITTDEVRKHITETLRPIENKIALLASEDATRNQKIESLEAITHKHHESAEVKERQQFSIFDRLNTSLSNAQDESRNLEITIMEQKEDYAAVKVELEAQGEALTNLDTYVRREPTDSTSKLDELVTRNSNHIQLLQQDCKKLDGSVRQIQSLQAASKTESPSQALNASTEADKRIEEQVTLIRHDLDALNADRKNFALMRTDLDSLINEEKLKDAGLVDEFEAIETRLNKQYQEISRLQNESRIVMQAQAPRPIPNHPPTPPFASASTSPRLSDQQKLQDVEMGLKKLIQTTQALELFVNSQQQRFDGLSSDRVVQSMVHQMQQMYPQHPGNLLALVNQIIAKQGRVDSYLSGNLKDFLAKIETQIAAQGGVDSRMEKISQFTSESRHMTMATVNSLMQDVKGLKAAIFNNGPQEPLIYGSRIDELADRVMTVEARYVKAIGDLQTTQTDLVRDVTHLQHQNGTGSTKDMSEGPTVLSRGSKSVEPNQNTVSSNGKDDSDGSDTPLSQRSDRGLGRDREGYRASSPNVKRKAVNSDDAEEDEGEETKVRKIAKRRNVSGMSPLS